MNHARLIACHECDLLQHETVLRKGGTARCTRCGAMLYRDRPDGLSRSLACTLGALVLFGIANAYPIVGLDVQGTVVETTLLGAVRMLYAEGMWPLAGLVLATSFLMPLAEMCAMAYLLFPLVAFKRAPRAGRAAFRALHAVKSWGMTEVLILGFLVALVKLAAIASVVPGISLFAFGGVMLLISGAASSFDAREVWARIDARAGIDRFALASDVPPFARTAAKAGLFVCHDCALVSKAASHAHEGRCPRCNASLHFRKPDSISRTWALLIAAMVLYIPANVLPVMNTSSLFGAEKDTIMSGVAYLWTSGSWPLALLVFIASIAVPMLKILSLVLLVTSTQFRARWLPARRTRIYRIVEFVGRWSMLDIYVITVLVALVQFNALATIHAGAAAVAFGAVVVLTMLAAMAFDPRLMWDALEDDHG
ncbi:Paraquat-inducible protein A [Candidatus Burkholderia verschuerenii]|uniref:Paraquat-inducible protein A n=1 Tax=Candidatus Burkholderia verschuerenii TaxID=242163 RepID=A0A0L0M8U9_9BURK|nr:paraquat-inducible protein A [Candidatus Burkholderia verschuerenii]KND59072.1 Paraquat-inducible protein A [Candidatus Burkholderia verschuerenii]